LAFEAASQDPLAVPLVYVVPPENQWTIIKAPAFEFAKA
jgi:hypothetical protein